MDPFRVLDSRGFVQSALREGLSDLAGEIRRSEVMGAVSEREILQRELLKERIRGEIIRREAARINLLEEEARREVELELAMATHLRGSLSCARIVPRAVAPSERSITGGRMEERMVRTSANMDRESLLRYWTLGGGYPPIAPPINHDKSSATLTILDNEKPSTYQQCGTKRTASELLHNISEKKEIDPLKQGWSCALCQVSTTSRTSMDMHIAGKRHRSNAELMSLAKREANGGRPGEVPGVLAKREANGGRPGEVPGVPSKDGSCRPKVATSSPAPANVRLLTAAVLGEREEPRSQADGTRQKSKAAEQPPEQRRRSAVLRCELCKVSCYSTITLEAHLGGKKHKHNLQVSQPAAMKTVVVEGRPGTEVSSPVVNERAHEHLEEGTRTGGAES